MGIGVSGTGCIACGILVGIAIGVWGSKLHWMWNFGGHSHRGLGGKLNWMWNFGGHSYRGLGGKLHWMWNFGGHSHRGLGGQVALDVEFWWA